MKYTSILLVSLFMFSGCLTHPSPKPEENIKIKHIIKKPKSKDSKLTVFFEKGSFKLSKNNILLIDSFKKNLNPEASLMISGYASNEGTKKFNLLLSKSRADAVNSIIDFKNTNVFPLGEVDDLCKTENCFKKNRKVVLFSGKASLVNKFELIDTQIKTFRKGRTDKEKFNDLVKLNQLKKMPYRISSGDRLNISIYGEPELTIKNGVVKPDGTLTIGMVGDVKVSGKSINEAMSLISNKLKRYLRKPIVSLIPVSFRAQSYTILGKINKPGNYPVNENSRVLDTIADAGGFSIGVFKNNTIELADLEHAFIRRGKKVLPVDFMELVRNGNPLHNVALNDKDYIYIPSALNTEVYVLGESKITGNFGYREHLSLLQQITYAGGYTDAANINEVAIIRGYLDDPSVYIVNFEEIIEGREKDFMLKPFDIIFIPKSHLGDWNSLLASISESLSSITSTFMLQQLILGGL